MTVNKAIKPLTIGHLARGLAARAGQPVPALRCYESLAALWIRCCDTGLPGAAGLQEKTWRAARRLAAGESSVVAPDLDAIPIRLARDESLVRLPASLAVQGVEWQDAVALAQVWLDSHADCSPVLVAGVRTGGAYLAPLVAAGLKGAGVDVRVASIRPGECMHAEGRRVLLVDDPPLTGRTLLELAKELSGPDGVEVLVPVFADADVVSLRDAGLPVTVLPRQQWQSTRRLEPDALSAYLEAHATRPGADTSRVVEGLVPGRENSALAPWPGVRRRSPARAALRLRTPVGVRQAVASWVPPGIFGDAARAVATGVDSPVPPATLAVAPALVVSEDLTPARPLGPTSGRARLEEAVEYVLARAQQLPVERPDEEGPVPAVLRTVAQALAGTPDETATSRLHQLLSALPATLPDHRCEAEKWLVDATGRLRKTGYLTHAYRRDNELLTALIDLAALSVTFGCGLQEVADSVARCLPDSRSWHPPLAAALLCYGSARGAQLPRTYNPQRAAETAVEAYRLQRGMSDAALLVQRLLTAVSNRDVAAPYVVRQWSQPPAALVQPRLPFGGVPSRQGEPGPKDQKTEMILADVERWAEGRFLPVREDQRLLLAPLDAPSAWPRAREALEELARLLPHPGMLAWCGVPVVPLSEAC
ncbi:hypothetical protein SUDANB106_05171 [Streptomyces sp. enrichment culture]|uniref:phosphoribosyltransferase n=1 Tax=Streptomyces sp. enrichment culture TaxID=1795815 RepID=UPI003F54FDED